MRQQIMGLLEREYGVDVSGECAATWHEAGEPVIGDLLILDERALTKGFPEQCHRPVVIVLGAEPDQAYRSAALEAGADVWLPREAVGDGLAELVQSLGQVREAEDPLD